MGVMTRIREIVESAWQEVTERTVNPQREVDGFLAAQSKHLEETERLYEQTLEQAISLRQQHISAAEMAAKRAEQAELAMRAGEETLARLALQEKLLAEAAGEQYRAQYAQSQDAVLALAEELKRLRAGYAEASEQREYYAAKLESAHLQRRLEQRRASQDTLRDLGVAGREIGRDVGEALREAGRLSRETLQEAGGALQRELHEVRSRMRCGRK